MLTEPAITHNISDDIFHDRASAGPTPEYTERVSQSEQRPPPTHSICKDVQPPNCRGSPLLYRKSKGVAWVPINHRQNALAVVCGFNLHALSQIFEPAL
jgi:hypothetical protein